MVEGNTQMGGVWGWRGVLGLIVPSVYGSHQAETFYKVAPEGVGLLVANLGIARPNDENLAEALTHLDRAARQLAENGANYVHLAGPFAVFGGAGGDEELKRRLEEVTNLPSSTLMGSLFDGLSALSVQKLIHVSPGFRFEDYESRLKKVFGSHGIDVVNFKRIGIQANIEARKVPGSVLYNSAREAYLETPQADGIYIACGAWGGPPAPVVECLEQDLGKPVVCTYSVFLWAGLKALKIKAPVKGFGRLFKTLEG